MKEQLRLLHQLQGIDSQTLEVRQQIESLPKRLDPAKTDLARLQALLATERAKLEETEKWRAEQEEMIRVDTEGVKAAKVKLAAAKSARDYAMANREIDNKRRSISTREEEVLKVVEALESTTAALVEREAGVNEIAEGIAAEEAKIAEQVAELTKKVAETSEGRDEIAVQIDKALLRKYETIIARRGVAMVPVKNGDCGGCHMQIPPQLNNIVARMESVEVCPACYRLLYRAEMFED